MKSSAVALSLVLALAFPPHAPAASEKLFRICDDVAEPAGLDPFQVFAEKVITMIQQVMEGLIRFDPEGKIEPALAESWERIDEKTVRFHLRKGVSFHNGELFDAKAVKFSIDKYLNPETKYPGFGFIGTIAGVNIVDDYTVDILTHIPDGLLLNRLAAFCHIAPPGYYQQVGPEAFAKAPVGTGPFMFHSWVPKDGIVFAKNPNYWMAGWPKLDKLKFMFIPSTQQMKDLIAEKVDLVTEFPGTFTIELMKSEKATIVKQWTFYTMIGSFNITRGPLKNPKVRQAINLSILREDFIDYEVRANGKVIATTTMAGEEGHDPTLKPYPYNKTKALQLLKEAGYPDGLRLKALVKEQGVRPMGVIKYHLEQIGVYLDIKKTTDADIVNDIASQQWDILFGGCPDPMAHSFFIQSILFYSKSPYAICANPEFDRQLEEMMVTLDQTERAKKARALDRYVYNNYLGIFTYQRLKTYGVGYGIEFVPYVTGMPHFFKTTFD